MAGETAVETPQDNTKVEETIKTDKEVIAEEEAAQANEVKWKYFQRGQKPSTILPSLFQLITSVKLFTLFSPIFLLSKKTIVILAEITREISDGHRHINIY